MRGRPRRNLEVLEVAVQGAAAGAQAVRATPGDLSMALAAARTRVRGLLDLSHFVDSGDATDARGPRCDLFLVADLSEEGIAELVPPLVSALAGGLRQEFHPILRAGDGALAVCPLLVVPRDAPRERLATAVRALAGGAASSDPARRPQARIYLVEDQSGKYLLSRAELRRSFSAFLHVLLFSRLRDDEGGVRPLVELSPGPSETGPFATFACATLEADQDSLTRLCALRLARDVLEVFRRGGDPSIGEIAAAALQQVPDRMAVEAELWKESSVGTLSDHLKPPAIDVATVAWEDAPEEIVERKYGVLWQAGVARKIGHFRDEVERFKMDRLASEIERNGKAQLDRLEAELQARVARDVESGPRGHAKALEFCRDALTRAKGLASQLEREVESPDLPSFPDSPLPRRVQAIQEAVFHRPRRWRMKAFGVLATALGAVLTGGVIASTARLVAAGGEFFDPRALELTGWAFAIAGGPMPFLWGGVLSASSYWYRLWSHFKRHHVWVTQERDALDQALKGYLSRDVVAYFHRRLRYTQLLWAQRIYRRIADGLEAHVAHLQGVRAALGELDQRLELEQRSLSERLTESSARGGILYRGLLGASDAEAVYHAVRPADVPAVAERYLAHALAGRETAQAPFLDRERLLAFCEKELSHLVFASPFAGDVTAMRDAAHEAVRTFLRQLSLKLSPPLLTVESASPEARTARRIALLPPEARQAVESTMAEENLAGGWELRAVSGDGRRIHLVIARGDIPLSALALVAEASPGGAG